MADITGLNIVPERLTSGANYTLSRKNQTVIIKLCLYITHICGESWFIADITGLNIVLEHLTSGANNTLSRKNQTLINQLCLYCILHISEGRVPGNLTSGANYPLT
jgi:hypothetical protein